MKLTESTLNSTKRVLAERAVQKYLKEGLDKDQIQAKLIEEGFLDKLKGFTGLGMTSQSREIKEKIRSQYSVFMEYMDMEFPTSDEIATAIEAFAEVGRDRVRAQSGKVAATALSRLPKKKQATIRNPRNVLKRIKQMSDFIDDAVNELSRKGDRTTKKVLQFADLLQTNLGMKTALIRSMKKDFLTAAKTGETEELAAKARELKADDARIARASKIAFAKQQDDMAKDDRESRRQARNRAANEPGDIIRGKSTERFGLGTKGAGG